MSNIHFISRMMIETFSDQPTNFVSDDFHLRRHLSRMGIRFYVGQWTLPRLARFEANGSELDIALDHKLLRSTDAKPLVEALGHWTGESLSNVIVMTSQDKRPWLLLWDELYSNVDLIDLKFLFKDVQKAA